MTAHNRTVLSDLDVEQGALDRAHVGLAAMRARARRLLDEARASGGLDLDLEQALIRRVSLLAESPRALCFGRIDEVSGATWRIGRRHVEDGAGDPMVVEWRAPIAAPFYQARPSNPMGLHRRRTLLVEGRTVLSLADDVFGAGPTGGPAATDDSGLRGRDALLAELDRARTGEMLDIVATIQAEQDEVIRAPLEGMMAVQGGPGTGKTAIGLHRAAYLLYSHPDLARTGVLVVGPSRTFLRYIAQVLPSLGEEAVTQVTLADLVPRLRLRPGLTDPPPVQRVKGDVRMATVLANALAARQRLPEDDVTVAIGFSRLTLAAEDVAEIVLTLASREAPYQAGRAALRDRLIALGRRVWRSMPANLGTDDPDRHLRTAPELKDAVDRLWPAVSATELVNGLLSSRDRLARAGAGQLHPDEQALLLRPAGPSLARAPWTAADLALVDEARELIEGGGRTYGHVVVDEAQDLTPMQLRMVARRAPAGSVTLLGDLAQSTGTWWHESWADIAEHLPQPSGARHETLTLGYRTPGQVLDLASRLLPLAAPTVKATAAVRDGRRPPRILYTPQLAATAANLFATAAAEAAALAAEPFSVGVIVAEDHLARTAAALKAQHVDFGRPEDDGLAKPITLLAAPAAKGLEFDAVVVVEPAAIAASTPHDPAAGLRLLYVALTRPLQHLSIVHAEPLPGGLDS